MRSPKAPQEDPAVVAAREREERRAENARTEETQALLLGATQRRLRRFGRVASGGSVPVYGGGLSGAPAVGSGGAAGGGSGGGIGGGRGPGGGELPGLLPVLY